MARDNYTAIRIRRDISGELRRLVRQLAATTDRDITQSDALGAAISYALADLPAAAAHLPGESARDSGPAAADSAPGRPEGAATESETQQ